MLTPPVAPGAEGASGVTLAIELPDGRVVVGNPDWFYRDYAGVIGVGRWVPVTLVPDEPDDTQLDEDHVPYSSDVAEVIAEALGGLAVSPVAPDEWRVALALQFAEQIIAAGGVTPAHSRRDPGAYPGRRLRLGRRANVASRDVARLQVA